MVAEYKINPNDHIEMSVLESFINLYIHTYRARFIPERVAEASQRVLRDAHVLPKLFSYE
jgi:hypothetical protein